MKDSNRSVYKDKNICNNYLLHAILQHAEIIIFLKYYESFFGKAVLDIGCGSGRTTGYLVPFCAHYTGIDYSSEMLDLSRERHQGVDFRECDVRDMSMFPDEHFDFILFSYNGLDYISHSDRLKGLQEIYRVLRQGGLFVFSSHNRDSIIKRKTPTKPWLERAFNPVKMLKNIVKYKQQMQNFSKSIENLCNEEQYAIINDGCYQFKLTTYYISLQHQVKQLYDAGFTVKDQYDRFGMPIHLDVLDEQTPWIYYVAKK